MSSMSSLRWHRLSATSTRKRQPWKTPWACRGLVKQSGSPDGVRMAASFGQGCCSFNGSSCASSNEPWPLRSARNASAWPEGNTISTSPKSGRGGTSAALADFTRSRAPMLSSYRRLSNAALSSSVSSTPSKPEGSTRALCRRSAARCAAASLSFALRSEPSKSSLLARSASTLCSALSFSSAASSALGCATPALAASPMASRSLALSPPSSAFLSRSPAAPRRAASSTRRRRSRARSRLGWIDASGSRASTACRTQLSMVS
mmetsp:Transcript_80616/g.231439  ORF Transcript_80616/g.231439 Transcript_80616/m.231439 type:complete len:262 (-) Transcript_80616:204-989(-)